VAKRAIASQDDGKYQQVMMFLADHALGRRY